MSVVPPAMGHNYGYVRHDLATLAAFEIWKLAAMP